MGGIHTSSGVFEYFRYTPSVPAAATFIALFSLTTALHTYQLARTRTWILLPLVLGGYCEIIGYIGRILCSAQAPNFTIGSYLLSSLLALLAPALFAATIYMSLGRLIRATSAAALSPIPPQRLTALFVAGDVLGLAVQGAGAGVMTAGSLADFHAGEKVVVAGLAVLVGSFALFVGVAAVFDVRMRRAARSSSSSSSSSNNNNSSSGGECGLDWRADLRALYLGSGLVFVRSVFRLVEYAQGNAGWLMEREWTFYVFDAVLMVAVMVLFNGLHPSRVEALVSGGRYVEKGGWRIGEVRTEKEGGGESV
ncbi:hypothetical protein MMC11_008144 [Xylographa trunciseda]|nr:hypothetical protein [Xylographa trunciseda]